jgi:hypothetical protein
VFLETFFVAKLFIDVTANMSKEAFVESLAPALVLIAIFPTSSKMRVIGYSVTGLVFI